MPENNHPWAEALAEAAQALGRTVRVMEVCGTHTHAIGRAGLRALFPDSLELISGPGCPVCVTAQCDIERILSLAALPGVALCTFGDLVRVPGHTSSLERERARGAEVRVVYSPSDAVELARANPGLRVVFAGIGFETTAPAVAAAVLSAREQKLENFFCLSLHKRVVPVMEAVLDGPVRLDGFLTPGHVSVILGAEVFQPLARRHGLPCVATGFAPSDVLEGLTLLLRMLGTGRADSVVQYTRAVRPGGNPRARDIMDTVFEPGAAVWRGMGEIPGSGLQFRPEFERFDAALHFNIPEPDARELPDCQCGRVLRGLIAPPQCPQFGTRCTPRSPLGPCMVSSEGSCAARYRYG